MFSCETYKIFKNAQFEVCERLLLKAVLSLGLPFLMIYGFVCHVSLRYYCYIQKQSSGGALRKTCSNKFRKFHKKTPALKTYWSCRSTEFNSIKRELNFSNPKLDFTPVEHLQWSFFCKAVNSSKLLSIFAKKRSIVDVRPGSKSTPISNH